jgi:hypothetical protein
MSEALKLQYGPRFGDEVSKIAKSSLSVASRSTEGEVASARYTRWFHSEETHPEPLATSEHKFRPITAGMVASEIAAATKENLSILGEDASALFTPKLPAGHKLRKSIRSMILPNVPYLGSCKFGEVVTDRSGDKFALTQMFITNFDAELDTQKGASFYKPVNRDFSQMFFGVHVVVDREGNPLGFNLARGENGIAFKTKDVSEALYHIASASTGMSIEELQARMLAAKKSAK